MALVLKDRVKETTTTTGTGTLTLAGAMSGFQAFSVIGNTNTTYYAIYEPSGTAWEVGIGTYTLVGTTLSRDTILASSNSNNAVNFGAGTKVVFCTYPAGKSVYYDASGNVPITGALNVTSASATSFVVGLNGTTNPAFTVDSSTASQAAGFKITGAATGGTVALVTTDSGSNTNLTINAKGTGTIGIGSVSTGVVTITPNTVITGTLGIGGAGAAGFTVSNIKNVTGATTAHAYATYPTIQSDVTSLGTMYYAEPRTAASAFTLTNLRYFLANQGTFGATSAVTNQMGFFAQSTITSATNNYGFYSDIASGTGRWNLYANGTANNYFRGNVGINDTSLSAVGLAMNASITGATDSRGIQSTGTVQSDVTSVARYFLSAASTAAASFTLTNLYHFEAFQGTIGATSAVTNQMGFFVGSTLTGATNNYGFYSNIASAANRWNFYAVGTANNYFAGSVGIGNTTLTGYNLRISNNITGAVTSYGVRLDTTVQSDVTTEAIGFNTTLSTQAAAFTLPDLTHYSAAQGTIGATSAVTRQYGFFAASSLTGATTNYGFYSNIASGSGRWNFYAGGTANNYFAGNVGINVTPTEKLHVSGNFKLTGSINENVFTISDGAAVDLDPNNGTIQVWTLGASRSPTATNFAAGQSITLMVDDGSAYTITWPSVTWRNNAGVAPTLATTGYTVIALWKVSTTLYGALVGNGT